MKVRNLLLTIFAINILIIAIFSVFLSYNLIDNRNYMSKSTASGIMYEQLNNDTRQAQVNFQRQVQEWKNILIRGNNKELFDKYLKGFNEREQLVNDELNKVLQTSKVSNLNSITPKIQNLIDEHQNLGIEPTILNDYFNLLAQGDFNKSSDLNKNDKSSVAYHAKLMHFKLKNLVGTIIQMTDDIEQKALKINIASRTEAFMGDVKDVKDEIKGMSDTVKKFKI